MKTVGKYPICGLLGKGGMSHVFKARLPVVNKIVALKLFSPHPHLVTLLGEEAILSRFISEAIAIGGLRHPNIVDILDFDFAHGRPFFVMEYYYRNLGTLMGEGARVEAPSRILGLDKAVHYTRQILLGVSRLHRTGMVHRDIKPFNLLLTDEDRVKISDFGLSKLRGETFRKSSGVMVGSPYYAAPEQEIDADSVDGRADLYSVGIILYRMLTGRLPEEEVVRPSEFNPVADSAWDEFILHAVEKNPARRFGSATEMLQGLERLATAWEEKKRSECRMSFVSVLRGMEPESPTISLRKVPVKVRPDESRAVFSCDAFMRPLGYVANDFRILGARSMVWDRSTGLLWQRRGAEDPLDWREANAYIERLNVECFSGHADWRLPTVDELFSLLKPPTDRDNECEEGSFDPESKWLWSCDRRSFASAWYVDAELGFACWADLTCRFFARAVSDHEMPLTH